MDIVSVYVNEEKMRTAVVQIDERTETVYVTFSEDGQELLTDSYGAGGLAVARHEGLQWARYGDLPEHITNH